MGLGITYALIVVFGLHSIQHNPSAYILKTNLSLSQCILDLGLRDQFISKDVTLFCLDTTKRRNI